MPITTNLRPSVRFTVARALEMLTALDAVTDRDAYRDDVHAVENLLEDALNSVSSWMEASA